jgi:hypothetical protein
MIKKTRGCMSIQKNGKSYYENNKKYYIEKSGIQKKYLRLKYIEYKKTLSCLDCGKSDFRFMEFDHINNDKEHNVSAMISKGFCWENILKEINKCEPVCANCHNIRTWERNHTRD